MKERDELLALLEGARERGLVGSGPLAAHLDHALAWAAALEPAPARFLDLGTGAGVPGLVLALTWPTATAVLLDARHRSAAWVGEAVERLGVEGRVEMVEARAEAAARDPRLREAFPLVVARGFAATAVTAECGAAFVAPGGRLSVSEPPATGGDPDLAGGGDRWPEQPLAELALRLGSRAGTGEASFVILEKTGPLDDRWPRRVGIPGKRPLWS